MRAPSLGDHILAISNRKSFFSIGESHFQRKFIINKYKVEPQFVLHNEFLIDFKNKEFETVTIDHECDAIILNLLLRMY